MKDCTIDTPHMTRTTTIRMTRTKLRNVIHTSGMMYLVRPRMMVQRNVISWLLIMTILTLTWTTHVVQGAMINQNENKFNQQWSSGIWDYQVLVSPPYHNRYPYSHVMSNTSPITHSLTFSYHCLIHPYVTTIFIHNYSSTPGPSTR